MSKGMNKRDLIVEPAEAAALEETAEGEWHASYFHTSYSHIFPVDLSLLLRLLPAS